MLCNLKKKKRPIFPYFLKILFILEKEHKWGRGKVRGGERIPNRPYTEHGARHRTQSQNLEFMTQAEIKSQTLNRLSHPGALPCFLFICFVFKNLFHRKKESAPTSEWGLGQRERERISNKGLYLMTLRSSPKPRSGVRLPTD